MQIRLTRKFAEAIDGIDLSHHAVGDLIDLPQHDADLIIAEGWASSAPLPSRVTARHRVRARGPDTPTGRSARAIKHLRHVQEQMGQGRFAPALHRRAEDRIREALHDSRAHTVPHSHR